MPTTRTRVAVLVDLANIDRAFKNIREQKKVPDNFKIDYEKLVGAVTLGYNVVSKAVYVGVKETVNERAQRKFLDHFEMIGFKVVSKKCKIINTKNGPPITKANFDVEIAVDTCQHIWNRECDEVILISGDSDFAYLLDRAKESDFRITIVSSSGSISSELRQRANRLILLDDLDWNYLGFRDGKRKRAVQ